MTETDAYISISCFVPLGPLRFKLLVEYFGSALKVWQAKRQKLAELGLTAKILEDWEKFKTEFDLEAYQKRLGRLGIEVVTPKDLAYPKLLKTVEDRPIVLYYQGAIQTLDKTVLAVVGSRRMTSYGRQVTEKLLTELSDYKITIASGLMYGIDEVAHRVALANHLKTIGIWAGGLDTLTGSRAKLAKDILSHDGIIATEYPLGFAPSPATFPVRNRIVSGISRAVLVVEAAQASGSLITASHAARQGREVLAVPGPITSLTSLGTNELIQKGAKLAQNVNDILEELQITPQSREAQKTKPPLDGTSEKILSLIAKEPIHIDDIVRASNLPTSQVSGILINLELIGRIKNLGSGIYALS